jgi:hypothetical protein
MGQHGTTGAINNFPEEKFKSHTSKQSTSQVSIYIFYTLINNHTKKVNISGQAVTGLHLSPPIERQVHKHTI